MSTFIGLGGLIMDPDRLQSKLSAPNTRMAA